MHRNGEGIPRNLRDRRVPRGPKRDPHVRGRRLHRMHLPMHL